MTYQKSVHPPTNTDDDLQEEQLPPFDIQDSESEIELKLREVPRLRPATPEDKDDWLAWCEPFGIDLEEASGWFDQIFVETKFNLFVTQLQRWPFITTQGDINLLNHFPKIAIVGSREISMEGERLAYWVSRCLVTRGAVTLSGGAIGTDTCIHHGTIAVKGKTICVLPSGLDNPSPTRNHDLFASIAENGLLLSPYPMGVQVRRYHYHERNALMVALCDAVVVVRAKSKSGTMITGNEALKTGVPLYVVAGSPDDVTAQGCLDLLTKGALFYRSADELLASVLPPVETLPIVTTKGITQLQPSSRSQDHAPPPTPPAKPLKRRDPMGSIEFIHVGAPLVTPAVAKRPTTTSLAATSPSPTTSVDAPPSLTLTPSTPPSTTSSEPTSTATKTPSTTRSTTRSATKSPKTKSPDRVKPIRTRIKKSRSKTTTHDLIQYQLPLNLTERQSRIMEVLKGGEMSEQAIAEALRIPTHEIISDILELELCGFVQRSLATSRIRLLGPG